MEEHAMPHKLLLLIACALALVANTLRADDTNLVLRLFPFQPAIMEINNEEQNLHPSVEIGGEKAPGTHQEKQMMDFYRKCGLTFPSGSYLRTSYMKNSTLTFIMFHYNTDQNQKLLGKLLVEISGVAMQVQLDALFVDFSHREIKKLARANLSPFPRSEDILQLWKNGKGTLIHALKLVTQSGVNAQIQAVSEHIYATEFTTPSTSHAAENTTSPLPIPGTFDTREAGAIFNVTPTVNRENHTIQVVLAPELTSEPDWQTLSVTGTDAQGREIHLSVPQPVFHSRNITTSILMTDQSTLVLGGMENPKSDGVTYLLLTATLLDASGRPLAGYAGDIPP